MRHHYLDKIYDQQQMSDRILKCPDKFDYFLKKGYVPHYYQLIFHSMWNEDTGNLARFRNLVAGRRGGKTLSAAEETVRYCIDPEAFHRDAHGKDSNRPLHVWILTPDYRSSGRAALFTTRNVLQNSNLTYGKDYQENKGEKWIEFSNGSIIEFKTAERPEQLVGQGIDILWIDEAAVIPDDTAWTIARPALSDREGIVISTTTPRGKNWYYDLFWNPESLVDPDVGIVEYRSIDNHYFPKGEWEKVSKSYHPLFFKREYMASFDAFAGVELPGEWLKYYESADLPRDSESPEQLALRTYIGVDPAISLSDQSDKFAMSLIGVHPQTGTVYLLEQFSGRISFPEQVQKIEEWFLKYRPTYIGIESNAYQAALAQQVAQLTTLPPINPVIARGKKYERILAMSALFKIGKVKIRKDHNDFIDEWINYDSSLKDPKVVCLDALEIALRCGGVLLPEPMDIEQISFEIFPTKKSNKWEDIVKREIDSIGTPADRYYDEYIGDYL